MSPPVSNRLGDTDTIVLGFGDVYRCSLLQFKFPQAGPINHGAHQGLVCREGHVAAERRSTIGREGLPGRPRAGPEGWRGLRKFGVIAMRRKQWDEAFRNLKLAQAFLPTPQAFA